MAQTGVDVGRLLRLYTLIAFVSAAFLLTAAQRLSDDLFSLAVVAIGSVALVTAILGFVTAAAGSVWVEGE